MTAQDYRTATTAMPAERSHALSPASIGGLDIAAGALAAIMVLSPMVPMAMGHRYDPAALAAAPSEMTPVDAAPKMTAPAPAAGAAKTGETGTPAPTGSPTPAPAPKP